MADEINFMPDKPAAQPQVDSGSQGTGNSIEFTPDLAAEKEAKYGTLPQMALTGLEGAAKGALGPLATLGEKALGFKPEDIINRQEVNPVTHAISEIAGFAGPAAVGLGEFSQAGVLSKAGAAVSDALGAQRAKALAATVPELELEVFKGTGLLPAEGTLTKAGAAASDALGLQGAKALAVKLGVENSLYTLGDEVSKYINQDPNSIQSAAMHVGLSGLLGLGAGSAIGKVSDLWISKYGPKAEKFAEDFANKLGDHSEQAYEYRLTQTASKNFPTPPVTPLFEKVPVNTKVPEGTKFADDLVDKISKAASDSVSSSAGALLGHLTGIPYGGIAGAIFGKKAVGPLVQTIMPSIIKPLLDNAPSGLGLKAMVNAVDSVAKGEALASKAAKGLFEVGSKELSNLIPDKSKISRLKDKVTSLQSNPEQMLNIGSHLGTYMPGHQVALSETAQNAVNTLNQSRPKDNQMGPLNKTIPPSDGANYQYERMLQIAEQPLCTLSFAKDGTLSPKDVNTLQTLYPGVYNKIVSKINYHMVDHLSKGNSIPFKLRGKLSMLLGQPLDYNFTPGAIQAIQATHMPQNSPQMAQGKPKARNSPSKVGKSAELAMTPSQARNEALNKA